MNKSPCLHPPRDLPATCVVVLPSAFLPGLHIILACLLAISSVPAESLKGDMAQEIVLKKVLLGRLSL